MPSTRARIACDRLALPRVPRTSCKRPRKRLAVPSSPLASPRRAVPTWTAQREDEWRAPAETAFPETLHDNMIQPHTRPRMRTAARRWPHNRRSDRWGYLPAINAHSVAEVSALRHRAPARSAASSWQRCNPSQATGRRISSKAAWRALASVICGIQVARILRFPIAMKIQVPGELFTSSFLFL